jgi:hypothetical protein
MGAVTMNEEQRYLARLVVALPWWEWRDGMLHGEVDPADNAFVYLARSVAHEQPRSHAGGARLPVLTDDATGGAMLTVFAKHLRATPMLTLGLILDRMTSRNMDISTITLGEAVARAMTWKRG